MESMQVNEGDVCTFVPSAVFGDSSIWNRPWARGRAGAQPRSAPCCPTAPTQAAADSVLGQEGQCLRVSKHSTLGRLPLQQPTKSTRRVWPGGGGGGVCSSSTGGAAEAGAGAAAALDRGRPRPGGCVTLTGFRARRAGCGARRGSRR